MVHVTRGDPEPVCFQVRGKGLFRTDPWTSVRLDPFKKLAEELLVHSSEAFVMVSGKGRNADEDIRPSVRGEQHFDPFSYGGEAVGMEVTEFVNAPIVALLFLIRSDVTSLGGDHLVRIAKPEVSKLRDHSCIVFIEQDAVGTRPVASMCDRDVGTYQDTGSFFQGEAVHFPFPLERAAEDAPPGIPFAGGKADDAVGEAFEQLQEHVLVAGEQDRLMPLFLPFG